MKTELLTKTEQPAEPKGVAGLYRVGQDGEVVLVNSSGEMTIVHGAGALGVGYRYSSKIHEVPYYTRLRGIQDIRFHCQ